MKTTAIYPGTFDPITFGHIDLVKRASKMFDHIIVAVADNKEKQTLFSLGERINLVQSIFAGLNSISIKTFSGLLTEFAKQQKCNVILRGLRVVSDFDYELQMANMNRKLVPNLETIFLTPDDNYIHVASSLVRTIAKEHGDLSPFVPPEIAQALKEKLV
ncbi:MAG: pantetheine-phosphate adenylyltransferase [Gammaproteobacteria bacterium]|jgi:pantetheine-phosphate adenylyltransferase